MIRVLQAIHLGILSGLLICMAMNHSVWLEMRINTALALPLCTAAGLWVVWIKKKPIRPWFFLLIQGAVILVLVFSYGADPGAAKIIPAALIREGLYLNLPLFYINMLLIFLVAAGNISVFFCNKVSGPGR